MPLEISEIAVRLAVGSPTTAPRSNDKAGAIQGAAHLSAPQFEDLVRTCVQEVLSTLRQLEGR